MWKSFLEPNPKNLVQFLKGKPRMCEGPTRTPGASHSHASLPQAPVIHHSYYLSVPASLWHLVSSAPYKQVCIPTPTAMQFFPGWTCRFQGTRMTYDLSSLTSLRNHWFSVCSGFSYCKDKSDEFQAPYLLEMKVEIISLLICENLSKFLNLFLHQFFFSHLKTRMQSDLPHEVARKG